MARDIEVFEADCEADLKSQVDEFVAQNAERVIDVSYSAYTDYETKEMVYAAGIMLK